MDTALFRWLNDIAGQSTTLDAAITFCATYLPYGLITLLGVAVLWRRQWRMLAAALVSGIVARGLVKSAILLAYHRPRPFVALASVHQLVQVPSEEYHAFPSGHALFFFAIAMAAYRYDRRLGQILFGGAALVGISRIIAGVHWPTDILAGAILGILTAYALTRLIPALRPSTIEANG